jgi:hypothetical protein
VICYVKQFSNAQGHIQLFMNAPDDGRATEICGVMTSKVIERQKF